MKNYFVSLILALALVPFMGGGSSAIIKSSAQAGSPSKADIPTTNVKPGVNSQESQDFASSLFNKGGLSVYKDPFLEAVKAHNDELAKEAAQKAAEAAQEAAQAAEKQREAEIASQSPAPTPVAQPNYTPQVVSGCGDNQYANFIYMHESGCQLYNPNPTTGACGLGQANPCSKLLAVCPNLDYVCENAYFTNYANSKGGWYASYLLWISQTWW